MLSPPQLPDDPRDYYVFSNDEITLDQVCEAYKERPGASIQNLKKRSADESWVLDRQKHLDSIRLLVAQGAIDKKIERIVQTVEELDTEALRHTQLLLDKVAEMAEDKAKLKPSEIKNLTETLAMLHKAKRFHSGIEPDRVYGQITIETEGDENAENPLIAALTSTAAQDWATDDDEEASGETAEASGPDYQADPV